MLALALCALGVPPVVGVAAAEDDVEVGRGAILRRAICAASAMAAEVRRRERGARLRDSSASRLEVEAAGGEAAASGEWAIEEAGVSSAARWE